MLKSRYSVNSASSKLIESYAECGFCAAAVRVNGCVCVTLQLGAEGTAAVALLIELATITVATAGFPGINSSLFSQREDFTQNSSGTKHDPPFLLRGF